MPCYLRISGVSPGPHELLAARVLGLHGYLAYLIVGAFCFAEASFFVGLVLPAGRPWRSEACWPRSPTSASSRHSPAAIVREIEDERIGDRATNRLGKLGSLQLCRDAGKRQPGAAEERGLCGAP